MQTYLARTESEVDGEMKMTIARVGIRGFIGAAWTVALAVAVLPLLPMPARSEAPPVTSAHLKSLFDRHDVRYVLRANSRNATDCLNNEAERGQ
jgi:hypothetical protein